jgi:hypothetical protein
VRAGILAAIGQDVELRGGRTARRVAFAGFAGVAGAIGAMLLVATHPFDHHPHGHELVFSAVWTGLLVVSFCLMLLQVKTPEVPLDRAAAVGLMGLGLAGLCSLLCPDPHVMSWWLESDAGSAIAAQTSTGSSAVCFGFATVFLFALAPAMWLLPASASKRQARLAASGFLTLLLAPGVILESVGLPLAVLAAWIVGTVLGSYAGVASGVQLGSLLGRR